MIRRAFGNGLQSLIGRITGVSGHDIALLRAELGKLHHGLVNLAHEQSLVHSLVTTRMSGQLDLLNRQLHDMKREIFRHAMPPDKSAFNGQFSKHSIFADLCAAFAFDAFVETGSYLGHTTNFLASTGKPVYSVEINPDFHSRASEYNRDNSSVVLMLGDSPDFLRNVTSETLDKQKLAFFYLDAHWEDHLPLREELDIIATNHPHAVVMIDDFKIDDDPGYGFDSYPGEQEVSLRFLADEIRTHEWKAFFPTLPSARDHMLNDILPPRGTAIMACDEKITKILENIPSLRHWPISRS